MHPHGESIYWQYKITTLFEWATCVFQFVAHILHFMVQTFMLLNNIVNYIYIYISDGLINMLQHHVFVQTLKLKQI